jgi:hypothetical protein
MHRFLLAVVLVIAISLETVVEGQCTEPCTAIHTLDAEAGGDFFGWVSNDMDDIDGDGVRDFILTAPRNDGGGLNAGRVYVYSGQSGDELFRITGTVAAAWLGHDAASAGDMDGDGLADVIAGAPFTSAGFAGIYSSGRDGALIHAFPGEVNGDQFGFRVYGGGDFDGDGTSDVVIGAPGSSAGGNGAGRAYIYSGADFSEICVLDGITVSDRFGSGVAFVGDVTGDGRDDVAIGAQDAGAGGGFGYVYSYDGIECQLEYLLLPGQPSVDFGLWFMNGGHDVNDDGVPDIYVNDFGVNRGHIFSGVDGSVIWQLNGEGEGGGFGIGRIVPDLNGDFHADMILASWASSVVATGAGKVFIYSGRTGEVLETFTHNVAGAGFGFDANGMGDVDGDGKFDHLITAASHGGNTGRAFVIAGTAPPVSVGDGDEDGDIDLADYGGFLGCVSGAGVLVGEECEIFDLDFDADVDLVDFGRLQRIMTGP